MSRDPRGGRRTACRRAAHREEPSESPTRCSPAGAKLLHRLRQPGHPHPGDSRSVPGRPGGAPVRSHACAGADRWASSGSGQTSAGAIPRYSESWLEPLCVTPLPNVEPISLQREHRGSGALSGVVGRQGPPTWLVQGFATWRETPSAGWGTFSPGPALSLDFMLESKRGDATRGRGVGLLCGLVRRTATRNRRVGRGGSSRAVPRRPDVDRGPAGGWPGERIACRCPRKRESGRSSALATADPARVAVDD